MKKILFTLLSIALLVVNNINAQLETYQFQEMNFPNGIGSVSGTAVFSGGDFDTNDAPNIPIGFDFKYAGQTYNSLTISVDGAISFSEDNIYGSNDLSSTAAHHINIIAPFWDDLKLFNSDNGAVIYRILDSAPYRMFVVEWQNIRRYQQTGIMTFRLILFETTNAIEFQYGTSTVSSTDASIGFNSSDGSNTEFVSVTPGTPATASVVNLNNSINATDFPTNKGYIFSPPPENDMFQNAIPITLDDCANPIKVYNEGATYSGGNLPSCGGYIASTTRDVWYKFTAPQRGAIKITRQGAHGWSSISYAIHHGTHMNNEIIACNFIPTADTSQEIYNLVPGDEYLIRMWDYNNDDFGYEYFCVESLDNDYYINYFPITVQAENASSYVETYANNVGATASPGHPVGADGYNGGDLWFRFVAPTNGQIAVVHSDIAGDWSSFAFTISTGTGAAYDAHGVIYVAGFTAPYTPVIISGLTGGATYYLRAWDYNNDNFGSSPFYIREDTTTGIEDYTNLDFKYYPNPAVDVLNISAKKTIDAFTITNITGQIIKKGNPQKTHTQIHINELSKGIYLLNIQTGNQSSTVKFIKN